MTVWRAAPKSTTKNSRKTTLSVGVDASSPPVREVVRLSWAEERYPPCHTATLENVAEPAFGVSVEAMESGNRTTTSVVG